MLFGMDALVGSAASSRPLPRRPELRARLTSVQHHVIRHAEGVVQRVSEQGAVEAGPSKLAAGLGHQRVEELDQTFHFAFGNCPAQTQANTGCKLSWSNTRQAR